MNMNADNFIHFCHFDAEKRSFLRGIRANYLFQPSNYQIFHICVNLISNNLVYTVRAIRSKTTFCFSSLLLLVLFCYNYVLWRINNYLLVLLPSFEADFRFDCVDSTLRLHFRRFLFTKIKKQCIFAGNKQKWVPMEIEHPKSDRSGGRKGKGRSAEATSPSFWRDRRSGSHGDGGGDKRREGSKADSKGRRRSLVVKFLICGDVYVKPL